MDTNSSCGTALAAIFSARSPSEILTCARMTGFGHVHLCELAIARGDPIIRDKAGRGDRISDFIRAIGKGDRVYVLLSNEYLKSPFCMFELFEVRRNSRHDEDEFRQRVRLYAVDDAKNLE